MEIGKIHIAYVMNENGKDIHQAFRFIPLAVKDNQVHVMEDLHPMDERIVKGLMKVPFDELSKRDGNLVRFTHDTWKFDGENLLTGKGHIVRYDPLKSCDNERN